MTRHVSLPLRQVHLDFHTSPYIPDLFSEFNAEVFADTLQRAHVNSVTVFAKCHHGMSYFPTEMGTPHPALGGRDVLGDMIKALHARNIQAPIYTTMVWEEKFAFEHPEWRQVKHDGVHARLAPAAPGFIHPDKWTFLCFNNPEYADYLEKHVREIASRYKVDGIFMDIVFMHDDGCFCDTCTELRREHGWLEHTKENHWKFEKWSRDKIGKRLSDALHELQPEARLFYNGVARTSVEAHWNAQPLIPFATQWEIESLPSGFWGYQHFPRLARHAEAQGIPWLGMTGRFQRMWGDFGGIKPQAALEYECFRTQALGGANSVGDQLPPRGTLEPAAYDLIGAVYAQVEAAEPFYEGSSGLPEVGVFLAGHPSLPEAKTAFAEEGAVLALGEAHYDVHVLDDSIELSRYPLVVLPDYTIITDTLYQRLRSYYEGGGKIILSYRAGFGIDGTWKLDFLPFTPQGEVEKFPTYWRTTETFWKEAKASDRVFYEAGLEVTAKANTEVLIERVLPYFKRTDAHFMSHFQTPPVAKADKHPAVIRGKNVVYFADPVFAGYRIHGVTFYRDVLERIIASMIGAPRVGAGLPRGVLAVPRKRGHDLIVTLINYQPVRKAVEIDVIEEASSFAGETLIVRDLPASTQPRLFAGETLEKSGEGFALPVSKGRLLIEIPDYFAKG
jgi:hypothetical protein